MISRFVIENGAIFVEVIGMSVTGEEAKADNWDVIAVITFLEGVEVAAHP